MLIVNHGDICTNWLNYTSPTGRSIYANNFLVWNAILFLKKEGIAIFDLGGIDEINTPHITKFKRGLGGNDYRFIGEYVAI